MDIKILLILVLAATANSTLLTKKVTLKEEDQRFRESSFVLDNLDQFYYYLRLSDNPTMYNFHCFNLAQRMNQETDFKRLYYGYKISKELKCEISKDIIAKPISNVSYNTQTFSDLYYIFTLNLLLQEPKDRLNTLCDVVSRFINNQNPKIKKSLRDREETLDYGSLALKLLKECSKINPEFSSKAQTYASYLSADLKFITKSTATWISSNIVSTTLQIATSLIYTDKDKLNNEKVIKILNYLSNNMNTSSSYKELFEWNNLLVALDSIKFRTIGIPDVINLKDCTNSCHVEIKNLPANSKAKLIFNNKETTFNIAQDELLNLSTLDFVSVNVATIIFEHPEFTFYPTQKRVEIKQDNKISFTRMKTSAFYAVTDLMDSDDSECSSISLNGNESTFLHVGYRVRVHENFSFVYLEPENPLFEKSALVHSTYDEKEKLYISSFDLSDYETIRPNSDTYNIWIMVGDIKKQCGKITLSFMNKNLSLKKSLEAAQEVPLFKKSFTFEEKKRFVWTGLYFLFATICFGVAYTMLFGLNFNQFIKDQQQSFWKLIFYASLSLYLVTLLYLLSIQQLLEQIWIPVAQLFLTMITFKKSFYPL